MYKLKIEHETTKLDKQFVEEQLQIADKKIEQLKKECKHIE